MDKISYALGISMASNLKSTGINNLNLSEFQKGFADIIEGRKPSMEIDEAQMLLGQYFNKLQQEADARNKEIGEKFLAEKRSVKASSLLPAVFNTRS